MDDVRAWLLWTSRQCALGPIALDRFHVDGAVLAAMTEEEFRSRAPQGGDTLYAKLDIWRSAWRERQPARPQQPVPDIRVEEPLDGVGDLLACWMNTPQDLQQGASSSGLLTTTQQYLTVPSPASRSAHSPFSDHTHSGSEGFISEGNFITL